MRPDLHYHHANLDFRLLAARAFNHRWATLPPDVVALTAADPDFPVADPIREALTAYAASGLYPYGPHEGLPEFRRAAAEMLRAHRGIAADPDLILPIDSAASGMLVAARWGLQPRDEAIIFDPVDYLFRTSVEAVGARVVVLPSDPATGRPDLGRLPDVLSLQTRMIGVCNPINPTGVVLRPEELSTIAAFAAENGLWVLNDEVWSDIVYPPRRFTSLAAIPDCGCRTVTVYGLSKAYGLAGLRVGFVLAPDRATYEGLAAASQVRTTAGGVSTLGQIAAIAAWTEARPWVDAFLAHLTGLRDLGVARLRAMPGVQVREPEGTYLLFPEICIPGLDSTQLAARVLEVGRVAVVPGSARYFGPAAEGHLRIAFGTSREVLAEGLDRLDRALGAIAADR